MEIEQIPIKKSLIKKTNNIIKNFSASDTLDAGIDEKHIFLERPNS